jgi:uridine kinase
MPYPEAEAAIRRVLELAQTKAPLVVAIDGRSGAGKSTLAAHIAERTGAIAIDQDDFYSGGTPGDWQALSAEEKVDRVIDWRRVRAEVLEPLIAGRVARWRPFDWETMSGLARESLTAAPAPIIVLDGAYSSRLELTDLIDLSILVELPENARLARLKAREGEDLHSAWQAIWDEAEAHYFASVRPSHKFDIVIQRPNDPDW